MVSIFFTWNWFHIIHLWNFQVLNLTHPDSSVEVSFFTLCLWATKCRGGCITKNNIIMHYFSGFTFRSAHLPLKHSANQVFLSLKYNFTFWAECYVKNDFTYSSHVRRERYTRFEGAQLQLCYNAAIVLRKSSTKKT